MKKFIRLVKQYNKDIDIKKNYKKKNRFKFKILSKIELKLLTIKNLYMIFNK